MPMGKNQYILTACIFVLGLLFITFSYAFDSIPSDPVPWQEFKKKYGESWQVKWNEKTGTPHRVFGSKKQAPEKLKSLSRAAAGSRPLSENEFEKSARVFIDQNNGLFGIINEDLQLLRSKKHGSIFYVTFIQFFKNIPVYNSRVDFQFDNDGNLLLFGADVHPDINISVLKRISEENAIQITADDVEFDQAKDNIFKPELFIYPEDTKKGFKYSLVWRLEVDIKNPRGNWIYFINAENGKLIMKYNDIKDSYVTGKITGRILPLQYDDIPQEVPFPYESVYCDSIGRVSDEYGNYLIPAYGGTLTSKIEGKYLKVTYDSLNDAYYSVTVNDGDSTNIIWDTGFTAGRYDEMNVYYHSMKMRDYIKNIDPDFTGMDCYITAAVQLLDSDRNNSYWSNYIGMGFGAGTSGYCRSLALFADIIYHEYSHGVNNKLYLNEGGKTLDYINGTESGAMEEGFADYWACSLTDDPLFGEGVFVSRDYIRNIDNALIYPDDLSDEFHADGRIIAGAMWRMRKELGKEKADNLFHFARYSLPVTFNDFFLDVLMKDDDNNDLSDGTPNSLKIYSAFGSHGISGLQIRSISVDDRVDGNENGKMNPGEKLNLIVTLENKMFEKAEYVKAVLATEDIYTDILSGVADFGHITEDGKASGSFTILLDKSAPIGNEVSFNLKVSDEKGYTSELPFRVNISDFVEKKWRTENITVVAGFPDYPGNHTLVRDKAGDLYLMFGYDSLSYAFYDGAEWTTSVLDSSGHSYNYSLAVADNIPYLVYNYSDSVRSYLKFSKLNSGEWETENINSTDSSQYSYPSLAFDQGNSPQISYADGNYIRYGYKSGGKWMTEEVDTVFPGSNNSIGVGSSNFIQVAYYDFSQKKLRHAGRVKTVWQSGFLDVTLDAGKYIDLAMGPNGNSQLCYYDNAKGNLKYINSWETEIVDMNGDVGLYPSMAVDSNNLPHIVYYDKTNGAFKYAYYNGKFWEITKIDDSGDAGYYPSLVIDDKGILSASYYSKNSDGNIYLKFAASNFMASPVYLQPRNNSITDTNVMLKWMLEDIKPGDVIKYDVYLDTTGANKKIAENLYDSSYNVTDLENDKVYYWRVIYHDQNKFEFKCALRKFKTPMRGDIDKNGIIDGDDLVSFSGSFGSTRDFNLYDSISDIDHNGRVDGADLMFLGMNFGKSY